MAISEQALKCLAQRPQPFDSEAFELLVLLLREGSAQCTALFSEKLAANPWRVGEWSSYLHDRIADRRPIDLTFWRAPFDSVIDECRRCMNTWT